MWEQKLRDLREKPMLKAAQVTGMPFAHTNAVSDSTFERVSKIMELQADIDVFKLNIEKKIDDIERYIITLDDSLLPQTIEYRCRQCKTWRQVAAMIGSGTTEDSLKKYFNRRFPK